ncbi:MAG: tyrosine-type recombinase/integrase [Steroidobacteraceae bacterium]
MNRLTETALRAALKRTRTSQTDIADGMVPGLFIRLGNGGAATWSLRVRVSGEAGTSNRGLMLKGRKHRFTLGTYPELSIEAARAKANMYRDQGKKGENPVLAFERAATAGGLTIEALSRKFMDEYVLSKELRSARKYQQAIDTHLTPNVGTTLVDGLSRDQIRELLRKVRVRRTRPDSPKGRVRGGTEAARTILGVLRHMLSWAIREGLVKRTDNPASDMERNLPKKRKKDRVLTLEEARLVWRAAESAGYAFGTHARLMMLTGCRAGEWAKAQWRWVDLEHGLLVIPAEAYKTDHVHVVPLVPQAIEILNRIPKGGGGYILSNTDGKKPIVGIGKFYKTRLPREIVALNGQGLSDPFTSHDLRRTVATRLGESLGVGGEQLIQRVLGHSDGSVTAIYNRYGYVKEMRVVLQNWARDLTA